MKISTNLIARPGKFAPYMAIGLWLLSATLVLFAVFLGLRIGQLYQEAPALKMQVEQFNSRQKGVDAVALPPAPKGIAFVTIAGLALVRLKRIAWLEEPKYQL